ncbi:MAG: hypothetical protein V4511_00270 [Bacteroidota bacterium]
MKKKFARIGFTFQMFFQVLNERSNVLNYLLNDQKAEGKFGFFDFVWDGLYCLDKRTYSMLFFSLAPDVII